MKKFQLTILARITAVLTLICCFSMLSKAAESIQLDTPFTINSKSPVLEFTPSQSGVLYAETNSWIQLNHTGSTFLFSSEDVSFENGIAPTGSAFEGNDGWIYTFRVEAHKTYYVKLALEIIDNNGNVTFTFTMDDNVLRPRVTLVYPDPGKTYNLALANEMQLEFNVKNVTCDGVYMVYEDINGAEKEFQLDWVSVGVNDSWRINIQSAYNQIGSIIKKGSEFTIKIVNPNSDGVGATGRYVVDGNIEIPYIYNPMTSCTNMVIPSAFLTFWPEGDPAGIVVLTFDNELLPDQPLLEYGIFDGINMDGEESMDALAPGKLTIDGNKIYYDLTGVVRQAKNSQITLLISHLSDIDNMPVSFNGSQMLRYIMPYAKFEHIEMVYELTPAEGSLANTDEIELWIGNDIFEHAEIEAFAFDCDDSETIIVDFEQVRQVPDGSNYTLLYIPVPEMAKTAKKVILSTLFNSADGTDYSLTALYENKSTGIYDMESPEVSEYVVYNLQGIKVIVTDNYDDVNSLPSGVYIVNGKKIFISK